jgi:hypothetical protein
VKTHADTQARSARQRLTDLERKKAELERKIHDTRAALDRRRAEAMRAWGTAFDPDPQYDDELTPDLDSTPAPAEGFGTIGAEVFSPEARTASLINRGRSSAPDRHLPRVVKVAILLAVLAALLIAVIAMLRPGPGASWPASVAKVEGEIAKACQNPDVRSEPGQVNFACGKATRSVLWVFALLTSNDNPGYAQAGSGRVGLEPIAPGQGGVVAWSLNMHHPYNPANPIDSIEVAARAINNIIGGATSTSSYGNVVVLPGLESSPSNCLRYTGSSKVTGHAGFPGVCAMPLTRPAGQAALVADVYQKWVYGATPKDAQNAATLFENARNPGNAQVQAILKHLPHPSR